MDSARFGGSPRLHIRCILVSESTRIARWQGPPRSSEFAFELDPYVKQIVERLRENRCTDRCIAEAPVPLEFESPEWETPGDDDFNRRIPDDEPWDSP